MFGIPSPYAFIAGGVVVLAIAGGIAALDMDLRHYKKLYANDEVRIGVLQDRINGLTSTQNTQTGTSQQNVTKVITLPGKVQTVVKTIHDAPLPADCATPTLTQEAKDSF